MWFKNKIVSLHYQRKQGEGRLNVSRLSMFHDTHIFLSQILNSNIMTHSEINAAFEDINATPNFEFFSLYRAFTHLTTTLKDVILTCDDYTHSPEAFATYCKEVKALRQGVESFIKPFTTAKEFKRLQRDLNEVCKK